MTSKLSCLQGLRGISMLLVLIFHLYPKYFVNGFVGVDMFFVLSGYLMTRILSKEFTIKSVLEFYKKRFSRVVPLYYFTIIATIIGVLSLVLRTEREDFIFDVKWCLHLVSNMQPIFEHHSYWDQVSTIRFLTHLWSLCTELQYYLMAPAIHFIAVNLPFHLRILGYINAIGILCTFQLMTPFELSYCFLAARVWQFLLGSLAYEFSRTEEQLPDTQKPERKSNVSYQYLIAFPHVFLLILLVLLTFSDVFGEVSSRLSMSVLAALLCYFSAHLETSFFTVSPLTYFGDISYVVYLVHWPVINFVRYIQQKDKTDLRPIEALIAIAITLILALAVHYLLEKQFLRNTFSTNFTISCFIFALCYALIPWLYNNQCLAMRTLPVDLQEKAEFNLHKSNLLIDIGDLGCDVTEKTANFSFPVEGIEYCAKKGNGTGKILVIGNSLSIRAFPTIFKMFDGQYEEIRLFPKHGSAPLLNISPYYTDATVDMTREMKPDLLWIIQGINELLFHGGADETDYSSSHLDVVVQEKVNLLKEHSGLVYLDLPYYVVKDYFAKKLARSLIYRKDPEELQSVDLTTVERQLEEQTFRLTSLNCSNCYFNDIQKALTKDDNRFFFYNKLNYRVINYDGSHLTLEAYENYIGPLYQNRIDQYFNFLNNSTNDSG